MAVTIDPRPTYFGDRMVVTGSYGAGDTSIDLSSLLASIDFAGVNSAAGLVGTSPPVTVADTASFSGATITVVGASGTTMGGTFMAIGRRS